MKHKFIILIIFLLPTLGFLQAQLISSGEIKPFLLQDKTLKNKCNLIFKNKHVLKNCETLKSCGFVILCKHSCGYWVCKHPLCKGWLFKIFCEDQHQGDKLAIFWSSCMGEALLREYVLTRSLGCYFIVPPKWLYPIYKTPKKKDYPFAYVLVEKNIHCFQGFRNEMAWKCAWVTKDLLCCLHRLICDLGLAECGKIDTIPFCKEGKIVLRETHCYNKFPANFNLLTPCLCEEMQRHWCELINVE